jgi:hypothetical protein
MTTMCVKEYPKSKICGMYVAIGLHLLGYSSGRKVNLMVGNILYNQIDEGQYPK